MFEQEAEFVRYVRIFNDEITPETVQELIDVLVGVPSVDLFITTPGGCMVSMNALIHFINGHPDCNVHLVGGIASAGTFLLTDCTAPVYVTDDLLWILFHMGDMEFGGKFRKTPFNKEEEYKQLKEINERLATKFKKLGLTSKEIKQYFAGDDVVIYRKDFGRLKVGKK